MHLQPIQQIFKQKMDRKQFLRTVGLMVLVAVGLSFLLKQQRSAPDVPRNAPINNTYGNK